MNDRVWIASDPEPYSMNRLECELRGWIGFEHKDSAWAAMISRAEKQLAAMRQAREADLAKAVAT